MHSLSLWGQYARHHGPYRMFIVTQTTHPAHIAIHYYFFQNPTILCNPATHHVVPTNTNKSSAPPNNTSQPKPLPLFKQKFLQTILDAKILAFGSFTLKSGHVSPYFFNASLFSTASLLSSLASAYAQTVAAHPKLNSSFDLLFGPAYKGIPLATITATQLFALDKGKYKDIGYAFNRKEKKDYGEGGSIVGMDLRGKKVLIVDDVITAGTAIREAVEIIRSAGGQLAGIVVALDRQERKVVRQGEVDSGLSAIQEVKREYGVEVVAILNLADLIVGVGSGEERVKMEEYRGKYGAVEEA